jgi:hypothetical protein
MLRKTITQMLRNETMGDNLKTTKNKAAEEDVLL